MSAQPKVMKVMKKSKVRVEANKKPAMSRQAGANRNQVVILPSPPKAGSNFEFVEDDGVAVNPRGGPLKIGSDFAGISCPSIAMKSLGVSHVHSFHCEKGKAQKKILMKNFPASVFQDDIDTRSVAATPDVDLFLSSFPCQPFSSAGGRLGVADEEGRGILVFRSLDYIALKKPLMVFMENVEMIASKKFADLLSVIRRSLTASGYKVHEMCGNADVLLPQSRKRWYLVGIRCVGSKKLIDTKWPDPFKPYRNMPTLKLEQVVW